MRLTTQQIFTILFKDTPLEQQQWDDVTLRCLSTDETYKLPHQTLTTNTEETTTNEED